MRRQKGMWYIDFSTMALPNPVNLTPDKRQDLVEDRKINSFQIISKTVRMLITHE
jgi:hypothetical protein